MNFNLSCENFKQEIINLINESKLPVSVIYYIFQNLYQEIQVTYLTAVKKEKEKVQEEEKKTKEEENNSQKN